MRELARVRGETNPELHELADEVARVAAAIHDREELLDGEAAHGLGAGRVRALLEARRPRRPAEVRVGVPDDAAREGERAVVELGESNELTLKMRKMLAIALLADADVREAVTTLEDAGRTARRVLGGTHPLTKNIEGTLRKVRADLCAREASTGSA